MKRSSKIQRAKTRPRAAICTLPGPERAELQRQGAKAAARGETASANPMHDLPNTPGATGESADTWQQRHDAWQQGHDTQSSAPDENPPDASPQLAGDAQPQDDAR